MSHTSKGYSSFLAKMATILFLAHRIPYPPNKGDKLRAYQVLNHWTKQHKVFLGCFIDDPEDLQHSDLLRERCAGTYFARLHPKLALVRASGAFLTNDPLSLPYYRDRGLARWVRRVMASEKPDCAFVFSSVMAQYLLGAVPRPSRVLVDFVDVDSEKWAEYAATKTFPARQVYRREARQLLRFDRRVARQADASIFVSEPEAALFRKRAPEVQEKVFVIPNGIDSTYFSPENAGLKPELRRQRLLSCSPAGWITGRMSMPWCGLATPCYQDYGIGSRMLPSSSWAHSPPPLFGPSATGPASWSPARYPTSVPMWDMRMSWLPLCALAGASKIRCSRAWRWRDR